MSCVFVRQEAELIQALEDFKKRGGKAAAPAKPPTPEAPAVRRRVPSAEKVPAPAAVQPPAAPVRAEAQEPKPRATKRKQAPAPAEPTPAAAAAAAAPSAQPAGLSAFEIKKCDSFPALRQTNGCQPI